MARELQFRNNNDDTYVLNDDWKFNLAPLDRRLSLSPRYSKNGSNASGDRKSPSRSMPFFCTYTGETDAEYIDFMNALDVFFDEINFPFYLEDITNDRRCAVEVERLGSRPDDESLRYRKETVNIEVVMLDAEWQALTATVDDEGEVANDDTFTINNPGKEVYPVITLEATTQITEFEFRNLTNSTGFSMSILDFGTSDIIEIDSMNGTFEKNGVDVSGNIVEGGPCKLSNGDNLFRYNSSDGPVNVVVTWRRVYGN